MTTPPPVPPESAPQGGGAPNNDDKTMALVAHFGMVLFGWLPALIIYLVKSDSPWVKREAAKAFNFSILATGAYIALFILGIAIAVIDIPFIGCFVTLGYLAVWITMAAFGIMNGIKVNDGGESKYPFEAPLLK